MLGQKTLQTLRPLRLVTVAANEMKMKNDFIDVAAVRCISEL